MRANRRRQRRSDSLANPEAIRRIFERLRELLPDLIPTGERQLIKMLQAVRNVERRPISDTKRGRPSRWKRDNLIQVATQLRSLLDRETQGRISLNSFTSLYLRIFTFPADVQKALIAGDINLFEAVQLARLTAERLAVSPSEAQRRRSELLQNHLMVHGSQSCLRMRVNEQLGEQIVSFTTGEGSERHLEIIEDLIELDPYDAKHMFWDELRRISFALRQVMPEDIDDKILNDFLSASDHLSGILARIEKRRKQRELHFRSKLQI